MYKRQLVTRINRFFGFSWEAKGQRYPLKASADREEPALANIIVTCTDVYKRQPRTGGDMQTVPGEGEPHAG